MLSRRKLTLDAPRGPSFWMSGKWGLGVHVPWCSYAITWAELLLVVIRCKYSSLSPPNSLFVFFPDNCLPVPNCFWHFLHHFHLFSNTDEGCFTHHFQSLRAQDELKSVAIFCWWICVFLPTSMFPCMVALTQTSLQTHSVFRSE